MLAPSANPFEVAGRRSASHAQSQRRLGDNCPGAADEYRSIYELFGVELTEAGDHSLRLFSIVVEV
jgi:hypothetical protein